MSRQLPPRPSLEHLKKQAKDLLAAARAQEPEAIALYGTYFQSEEPTLARAQLALARDYGFDSWKELSQFVAGSVTDEFVDAALGGHVEKARSLWERYRDRLVADLGCAALAGQVAAVMGRVRVEPELLDAPVGPRARPLLTYVCFSRLISDEGFAGGIRELCRELLAAGADPNACYMAEWGGTMWRQTPLYGAAGVLNDPELTQMLADAGADPDDGAGDSDAYHGETLYHACDFPGRNECLRIVLLAGPSKVGKDYCIKRKLDFEDIEGVQLFLDNGADPNANHPRTALSHAILRGRSIEMLRLLLSYGADPNVRDEDGSTPYLLARRLGNREAARLLEEHGATTALSPHDAILVAAADGDGELVKALALRHPEVVTEFSDYGRQQSQGLPLGTAGNVLQDMARLGQVAGLRALLDLGMDPGLRNPFAETALHWAGVAGRAAAAELLLSRGAPLDATDINHGGDPLGWTIWGSTNWNDPEGDYAATAALIFEAGAPRRKFFGGSPAVREALAARGAEFSD